MNQCLIRLFPLFVTAMMVSAIHGETIPLGTLPNKRGKAPFVVYIQSEPVAGDGYQPLHVTITPLARTFTRDHRVTVRLTPRNQFVTSMDFQTDYHFALRQGNAAYTEKIYVPYYYPWDNIGVRIFNDGREVETGYSIFAVNDLRRRYAQQRTSIGVVIPLNAKQQDAPWKACPDVRTLVTVIGDGPLPEESTLDRLKHKDALALLQEVQPAWTQFRPIDEELLHETWLGYSQLDVIILAAPVLARLETTHPQQMSAIIDWIAAGGNLWVYATEKGSSGFLDQCSFQVIPTSDVIAAQSVKRMLDLKQKNDTSDLVYDYWNKVRKASQDYSANSKLAKMSSRADIYQKLLKDDHPFARTNQPSSIASTVKTAKYGLGTIITINNEDPFPGSFQFWKSVANLHRPEQISWVDRNGVRSSEGDRNYWTWLIASVGQPPVTSFIILNTMFAIVIGPLAYFFFRRRERLYLLYFFAPAFALIVTSTLFAYAIFADGTATRVRTRQLTWMDTKHDINTTQSRQTYYAVFGSGAGLSINDNVAVYPVRISSAIARYHYHGNSDPKGLLSHINKHQQLAGSYLPARNQVQYLTIHPNSFAGGLSFETQPESMFVTNNLPLAVNEIVVCDEQGRFWLSSKIATGASAKMEQADAEAASKLIDSRVVPDEADVPMLNANRNSAALMQTGLLETQLAQWQRKFPRKHFIANVDLNSNELGVEDASVQDSVHVIMGELP